MIILFLFDSYQVMRSIDFMGKRQLAVGLSVVLVLLSLGALGWRGLNLSIEFTGGMLVELGFERPVDPEPVRQLLGQVGVEGATVQHLGSEQELVVRMPVQAGANLATVVARLLDQLDGRFGAVEVRHSEIIGASVGEDLRETAGLGLVIAFGVIMIYIMFRFTGKFSIGAVVALLHDALIVVGAFALFQWSFDLATLAAVLAVIGYSLNDTIVVFDRIRDCFRRTSTLSTVSVINQALNLTLERTLIMSLTTLMVLVTLIVSGGETLRGFALAMTIGVVVGTWSSIYVAATVLMGLNLSRVDLLPPVEQGASVSDAP